MSVAYVLATVAVYALMFSVYPRIRELENRVKRLENIVKINCVYFTGRSLFESAERSAANGNCTHHTREGAQAMADALNAVLKGDM